MAKWTWTDDEILAQTEAAHAAAEDPGEPVAVAARYDEASGRIVVDLDNDTTFMFPARLVQGVAGADPAAIAKLEVTPNGDGLRWPELDADLGLHGLLMGCFGSKAWMRQLQAERGRKGGRVTSEAKAKAVRENGKKGGRPRKTKPA